MGSKSKNRKIFVAMSGGVDSSVAAFLLKRSGYDVAGVFMRCYNLDGCAERDARDARLVTEKLRIPFYVWDFEEEYKKRVVDYMIEGYRQGITPNPDVECNREIKFGLFLERALKEGADYIATGHYIRLQNTDKYGYTDGPNNNPYISKKSVFRSLFAAKDANKDQSYFLWTLTQKQLRYCLFPVGDYLKSEVREIARKAGLPTAEKKDSQGICFLGRIRLDDFLRTYIPPKRGDVLLAASGNRDLGKKIGEHDGAWYYTIGQRHGLGLGQIANSKSQKGNTAPHYVTEKDVRTNMIVVAEGEDNPALYRKEVKLADVNFIDQKYYSLIRTNKRIRILARVRYRQPLARATLRSSANNESVTNKRKNQFENSRFIRYSLMFDHPVKFAAEGQSAVMYSEKGELLGGGIITASV